MRFPEYPTLSREEMNDLLIKSHNGDDLAREKLIEYNLKLVMKIVKILKFVSSVAKQCGIEWYRP